MVYLSVAVSVMAFLLSGTVAWLTIFRRGTLKMTQPAFVAFLHDVGPNGRPIPKVFIRALLYSTGKRGNMVESMHLMVHQLEKRQPFTIWGHGDDKLSRGSGLYVGETGVAANHHFNPPADADTFEFGPGEYRVEIFAALAGHRRSLLLQRVLLTVKEPLRLSGEHADAAIWFDWRPDQGQYQTHLETRRRLQS